MRYTLNRFKYWIKYSSGKSKRVTVPLALVANEKKKVKPKTLLVVT